MLHASGESAADRVYDEVKEQILTNAIAGGELISEGEVAQRFEVSRTPVREAFLRLQAEGWMRLYPKRGALVVPISERDARDVLDARQLLEGHAVRSVVGGCAPVGSSQNSPSVDSVATDSEEPGSASQLAASSALGELVDSLRRNLAEHRTLATADVTDFARVDAEFHQVIVAAGDNDLLAGFYTTLGERHRRMTTVSVRRNPGMAERILADHADLLQLIERGDATGFDAALRQHFIAVHDLSGGTR